MIPALVVFVALIVVFALLIPGMRPKDRRFKSGHRPMRSFSDLAKAESVEGTGAWVTTFLGLLAIASLVPAGDSISASTGAGIGACCGLVAVSPGLSTVRDFVLNMVSGVAAVVGALLLIAGNECGGSTTSRLAMLSLALFALATGLFISLFRFSRNAKVSGFQAFVVVELVTFLAAPLGVDLTGGSIWLSIAAATSAGLLVGASPEAVLSLLGFGISVVALWASTQTSDGCGMNGSPDSFVMVVSGMVTYFLASAAMSMIKP